ncbi:hypothetical protein M501DRAFT_1005330 [Patellaria atrata CBS 101060]|uniref:Uncharacterized protein n=1 Tax=Patellaria atrata CBS 101060 TaxID=1346257 RepID=A0A9P4S9F7_9PEZI|nr:hypothetical protein M501DRAFT_1005330 [Patellaria atrata CBS 101060]
MSSKQRILNIVSSTLFGAVWLSSWTTRLGSYSWQMESPSIGPPLLQSGNNLKCSTSVIK